MLLPSVSLSFCARALSLRAARTAPPGDEQQPTRPGCTQVIAALRAALLALSHLDDLRAVAAVSLREIHDALPLLRQAHARDELAKTKQKADRKKPADHRGGTPSKGLFGWLGGSGKGAIGN